MKEDRKQQNSPLFTVEERAAKRVMALLVIHDLSRIIHLKRAKVRRSKLLASVIFDGHVL
jgi:hypothetical protein